MLRPRRGLLLVRGVRRPRRYGALHLPANTVDEGGQQEFVVVAAGLDTASFPGDRVITTRHPGTLWEGDEDDDITYRVISERDEVLAVITKEGE